MRYETLVNCTFNYCVLFRTLQVHIEILSKYVKTLALMITSHFMRLHFFTEGNVTLSAHTFCFTNTVYHYAVFLFFTSLLNFHCPIQSQYATKSLRPIITIGHAVKQTNKHHFWLKCQVPAFWIKFLEKCQSQHVVYLLYMPQSSVSTTIAPVTTYQKDHITNRDHLFLVGSLLSPQIYY